MMLNFYHRFSDFVKKEFLYVEDNSAQVPAVFFLTLGDGFNKVYIEIKFLKGAIVWISGSVAFVDMYMTLNLEILMAVYLQGHPSRNYLIPGHVLSVVLQRICSKRFRRTK